MGDRPSDFTVADVLAWARTKPAKGRYDYCSNRQCAVAQFLRDTGRAAAPYVAGNYWVDGGNSVWDGGAREFDPRICGAANNLRETFGAFLENLEQVSA